MKPSYWLLLLAVSAIPNYTNGQVLEPEWEKQAVGVTYNSFSDVIENSDGSLTVLGVVDRRGTAGLDLWVMFFTRSGDTISSIILSREGMDIPARIMAFPGGGYLLAALNGTTGETQSAWVVRTDTGGKEIWRKDFAEPNTTGRTDIAVNENGTWWWLNTVKNETSGESIKLSLMNGEGDNISQFQYADKQSLHAHSIRLLPDQTIAISGQTDLGKGNSTMWVMRINANGEKLWTSTLPGSGKKISPECICCTPDNNLMVAGWIGSSMNPNAAPEDQIFDFDLILTKIDDKGKIVWTKNYDREGSEGGNAIAMQPDGKILIAGKCETSFTGTIGAWLLLTDKDGKKITDQVDKFRFGGDQAARIINTSDGGFLMVGPGKTDPDVRNTRGWIKKFKPLI